jgi:hypothetical protein
MIPAGWGETVKRFLMVVVLIAACATTGLAGWEFGADFTGVVLKGPAYSAPAVVLQDDWGEEYTITARQNLIDPAPVIGLDVRTPHLLELPVRIRGNAMISSRTPTTVSPNGSLGVAFIGPVVEVPFGSERLEIGAYVVGANTCFVTTEMPEAYFGDPGFEKGGVHAAPGTHIMATASDTGFAYSLGGKFPASERVSMRFQVMKIVGLRFGHYGYSAQGEDGGRFTFSLPQLRSIDLSGVTTSVGLAVSF